MPEETVSPADMASCECEPCKRKHGAPHAIESRIIHDYTSMPRGGWRPRYTAPETTTRTAYNTPLPPTFGIELETQAPTFSFTDLPDRPPLAYLPFSAGQDAIAEYDRSLDVRAAWDRRNEAHRRRQADRFAQSGNMRADEAVSLAAPRGLWHAKHDGSVSGPEFASQPGSLAYWRAQRGHLAGMFRALLHGGMRSHDGDRCGFHVNIGTDAFASDASRAAFLYADKDHAARFARLVTMNPRWSTRMSQRTHASARWASFTGFPDMAACVAWGESLARYGHTTDDHCSVLNASHRGRVEFRLPRGTLRLDRFYAKLEWTAAMVEYTRDAARPVRPSDFMRWADASGEYTALVTYMRERFSAARFGEEVA